jgi:predicted ArsR family transcriptional regulator
MSDVTEHLDGVAGIAALAEPARRALYLYVVAQPDAVGREQAAAALDLPVHTAKFHLDRLVAEGLLDVEFRRLTGRTGPGAGRPSKLYRRSTTEFAVSVPERRYDLAGRILAGAVDRATRESVPVSSVVRDVALEAGREASAGMTVPDGADAPESERAADLMRAYGYEPRLVDAELVLVNCPFDTLAREHTELVCSMNEAFVEGVLVGLGCTTLSARLQPDPELCCVRVHVEDEAAAAD